MHNSYSRSSNISRLLTLLLALLLVLTAVLVVQPYSQDAVAVAMNRPKQETSIARAVEAQYGKLPLSFVPNAGQTNAAVRFQARSQGGTLYFTNDAIVLNLLVAERLQSTQRALSNDAIAMESTKQAVQKEYASVQVKYEGANPAPEIAGAERLSGIANYFIGNDPAQWHSNIPTYAGVIYGQLYPGIDLRYDGTEGLLKGTYTVAPGVDPSRIRWHYEGARDISLDKAGNLMITLPGAQVQDETEREGHINPFHPFHKSNAPAPILTEQAPIAWQEINGQRIPVAARYSIADDGSIGFVLGNYDAIHPLILDPTLLYSTYIGGSGGDSSEGIAIDAAGNAYVTGDTTSDNFPTANPLQASRAGSSEVFVAKLNASGSAFVYSTYLGGTCIDAAREIAVDSNGNAYIVGYTTSSNFPTLNAYQPSHGGGNCPINSVPTPCFDVFVTKLNSSGNTLVYSTFLGGIAEDYGYSIATDTAGSAYITGHTISNNFPTVNPLQASRAGSNDVFVTKLQPGGNGVVYSTYLGGANADLGEAIAVDSAGNAYVTGRTLSTNFPTATPFQGTLVGGTCSNTSSCEDVFVTKITSSGTALVYSTYLGGGNTDRGTGITVDSGGNAYITGSTQSTNFPTANPLQAGNAGSSDVFVSKLNANGTALVYSTYLGGSNFDVSFDITLDMAGNVYLMGNTSSTNFPIANPVQASNARGADALVVKLNADGSALVYSTYLGGSGNEFGYGIAVDSTGSAYITGYTTSANLPTVRSLQGTFGGGTSDGFIAKIIPGNLQNVYIPLVLRSVNSGW